jgi:hypothetical protein
MNHSGREDELVASKDRVWVPSKRLSQTWLPVHGIGHTHLKGGLYQKLLKAIALLLGFLMYVFLITLIQSEFFVRIARRLQGDL